MLPLTDPGPVRKLLVLLGDQLDAAYVTHAGLDRDRDAIAMFEVAGESCHVPSNLQRTVLFLSAMRHFAGDLAESGWRVHYVPLDDPDSTQSLETELPRIARLLRPEELVFIHPGEWRVLDAVQRGAHAAGAPFSIETDPHFLCDLRWFDDWAATRRVMRLEHFYREQRRRLDLLVEEDGRPIGGRWSYDSLNRRRLPDSTRLPEAPTYPPDEITREVIELVRRVLPNLPGRIASFGWPVTRGQAIEAASRFIAERLSLFGDYQDAMRHGEHVLSHSLLSPALNMKLLRPLEVVRPAVDAYRAGAAPLNAVEGYVRQVIGWREFVRGVYWSGGSGYVRRNDLGHEGRLPQFYWNGETDMRCMSDVIGGVVEHGYGHHITRLMVTGNFALIAGVRPREVADWYLGMYVDGVDWATLPNVLGMAMYADGGLVESKPYAASGRYIQRMSNYCRGCRYRVELKAGDNACPFNVFYRDFMLKHERRFALNPRMALAAHAAGQMSETERRESVRAADLLRHRMGISE